MQRLVLFDLDDTLINRRDAFNLWANEFATAHALDEKWTTWLVIADAHHAGPMDTFFATVRDQFQLAEPVERLWQQYRRRMPELAVCPAETLEALKQLNRAGWRIGIVTNGMTDNQLGKIRNTGLADLVDGWCISGEAGMRKPDRKIFQLTAQRCGMPANHGGWMVGDSLALDIDGARHAGLSTIWVQPRLVTFAADPEHFISQPPDFTVSSVLDAATILLDM
jgi:HAD superfamily hydrolase (TIGR01549 family)